MNIWDNCARGSGSASASSLASCWGGTVTLLVSTSKLAKTNMVVIIPVRMSAVVFQENLLSRLCKTSEKKMPPRGAPSVTQPVAIHFLAENHWLTTLYAIVVGVARFHAPPLAKSHFPLNAHWKFV